MQAWDFDCNREAIAHHSLRAQAPKHFGLFVGEGEKRRVSKPRALYCGRCKSPANYASMSSFPLLSHPPTKNCMISCCGAGYSSGNNHNGVVGGYLSISSCCAPSILCATTSEATVSKPDVHRLEESGYVVYTLNMCGRGLNGEAIMQ